MFSTLNSPQKAYANVAINVGVESASPHRLILMLYEGALLSLMLAEQCMKDGRVGERGAAISKAISIIGEGLRASLNAESGGELAGRLDALYDYMVRRLVEANTENRPAPLQEVSRLLRELKTAWEEIASDPAVVSPNRAAA